MNDESDERLRRALRAALPPMPEADPARDLWPRVRARLHEPERRTSRLDWALLAAALIWLLVFPDSLAALLYHF